jgi:hypothetical protein
MSGERGLSFMDSRLFYDGPLKSNRGPVDKQILRREFHRQLKDLVDRKPMEPFKRLVEAKHRLATLIELDGFTFVQIITERLARVAMLRITLLTPEEPGHAVTQAGDLDNRVKTLLDALRVPKSLSELPKDDRPLDGETPFYCLLEGDALVSGLTVVSDRLLGRQVDPATVVLIIHAAPQATASSNRRVSVDEYLAAPASTLLERPRFWRAA